MSNVVSFQRGSYVLIDAGRCTGGDTPDLIGKWVYAVALVDEEGGTLHDYIGVDRDAADAAAVGLAKDFGFRIVDRSQPEGAR